MKIITITSYKGGVGKSTAAIHLGAVLSKHGKTILVDGDPNRTSIKWAGRGSLPFTVADERQAMKLVAGNDFVIIDTPARPDSDDLKELSKGCDLLILPTVPDILALEAMLETTKNLGDANYRSLLTIVPPKPSREGELMQADLQESGIPVFKTMIRRTAGFPKAALAGVPISEIKAPVAQDAWQDYVNLGKEIRKILK